MYIHFHTAEERSGNAQELIVRVRGQKISVMWTSYILLQTFFGEYLIKYLRQEKQAEVSA